MTGLGRRAAGTGGALALLLLGTGPAYAGGTLHQCMNPSPNLSIQHTGELPECTKVNGTWVRSWPSDTVPSGGGAGSTFAVFAVLAILIGFGFLVWKVSTARRLAEQSGLDPDLATQMTLLTEDGLDATYLAASLRMPPVPASTAPPTPAPGHSAAAERLTQLKSLLDQGLVTRSEYDERRKAIIDQT